jgi:hypothetical protein
MRPFIHQARNVVLSGVVIGMLVLGLAGSATAGGDRAESRSKAAEETREALVAYRRALERELDQAERWLEQQRTKADEKWLPEPARGSGSSGIVHDAIWSGSATRRSAHGTPSARAWIAWSTT